MKKAVEILYIFSSFFMIAILVILLVGAFSYWTDNYPANNPLPDKMFYIALGVAIVTSVAQWIEGRIKSIISSLNKFSRRKNVERN